MPDYTNGCLSGALSDSPASENVLFRQFNPGQQPLPASVPGEVHPPGFANPRYRQDRRGCYRLRAWYFTGLPAMPFRPAMAPGRPLPEVKAHGAFCHHRMTGFGAPGQIRVQPPFTSETPWSASVARKDWFFHDIPS